MEKKIGNLFKGDKVIWMVFLFLCLISIVEVFSASSTLTYKSQSYISPIMGHASKIFMGVALTIIILNIPCRYFKLLTPFLLAVTAVMLLWVVCFATKTNDAGRWISILGLKFQPSEIAKGTMVLLTAQILSAMQREDGADKGAFKFIMGFLVPTTILIGIENLSTAALLFAVIVLMMIIGRVPMEQLGKMFGVIAIMGAFALLFVWVAGQEETETDDKLSKTEQIAKADKAEESGGLAKTFSSVMHRAGTWKTRIKNFVDDKYIAPEDYDLDKNMQVAHANIAIVSSRYIGRGPGNSVERDYLPQAYSDFIYAIIIEEIGLLGAGFVAFLYIILLFRTARIARRCENNFPAFLAMGLALLLVIQATFNMLVAVGLAPVTGQPLPLISRGGTSTVINCAYIGVILSISRSAKRKKDLEAEAVTRSICK